MSKVGASTRSPQATISATFIYSSVVTKSASPPLPASFHPGAAPADGAIWIGEIDLRSPRVSALELVGATDYVAARLLVRVAGVPVGFVDTAIVDGRIDLDRVADTAEARFVDLIVAAEAPRSTRRHGVGADAVADEAAPDWLAPADTQVSVVLCTRNRAAGARACVESLLHTRHPVAEVIVVDNAPSDDSTERTIRALAASDSRVRYVREPRPGLSVARNRGVAEATGEIVAFTDDDVVVDPLWLNGLLRGFSRSADIACVTGIVISASLRHPAERYFDRRVWWSSSCLPRTYRREPGPADSAMHPYASGTFGTGANIAFRREAILAIGGFDNSLGAGSVTEGGEDLDAFVRILRAGYGLQYEPAALVRHHHRIDPQSLVRQMRGYGVGLGAYLTKYILSPVTRTEVLSRAVRGLMHTVTLARRSASASDDPEIRQAVLRAELLGLFMGPLAYLRSRRRQDPAHLRAVAPRRWTD